MPGKSGLLESASAIPPVVASGQPARRILDKKWDGRTTFNVEETSEILGLAKWNIYEQMKKGAVPSVRIGGRIIVPRHALERLLDV
jgi:hypothetical protein